MGAFGRMLIQYWGGDINRYDGNYSSKPIKKTKKQIKNELIFEEEAKFNHIKNACENLVNNAKGMMDNLYKDNSRFTFETKINKDFIKWKKEFLKQIENI